MRLTAAFLVLAGVVAASPLVKRDTTVQFDGRAFVNKGLSGFGRIKADLVDSYGETLGGLGSAIALESFGPDGRGAFKGVLRTQPDRGYNVNGPQPGYRARSHLFSFTFDPKTQGPAENVKLTYLSTNLYREGAQLPGRGNFTDGNDPTAIRPARGNVPEEPIDPSSNHITLDSEGLAFLRGGLYAVSSDEYGPYISVLERKSWSIVQSIRPPEAFIPRINGVVNFTTVGQIPESGRIANQGFEGLTVNPKTGIVSALLQSALAQDSVNGSKTTNRYSRLLQYDLGSPRNPRLVGEYVVPLPVSSGKSPKARAQSELHFVDETTYLFLPRDGNGFGDTDPTSSYKQIALFSTKGATNIAGTKYDSPANPVAPAGVLTSGVVPANVSDFISLIDSTQLAKFGLHNGGNFDSTLIASKIESIAVAPVGDAANPNDYWVFAVSDNDFITKSGRQATLNPQTGEYKVVSYSEPYAQANGDADTQVFIYRATLPGYQG